MVYPRETNEKRIQICEISNDKIIIKKLKLLLSSSMQQEKGPDGPALMTR